MRTIIHFRWLLALLLVLGSLSVAQATHMRGGDITYASIPATTAGVPRYHVVVRNFYEIGSLVATPQTVATITASKVACATGAPNAFMVQAPLTQTLNSSLLSCAVAGPLYLIALYEVDIDLPAAQWTLSTFVSARPAAIQNLLNPAGQNCYLSAYLDNTTTTQDVSPVFQSMVQPVFNFNALTPFSFSAFDADGDSLRYEIIPAANTCSTNVPTVPSNFVPHFTLNAATGMLTPTATSTTSQGYYNIVVRVSEYRKLAANRWVLIGDVMRDTIYLLFPTGNQAPTFTTMQVNGGAPQAPTSAIVALPGQTVNVVLQATDPDVGQVLRFVSPAAGVVPGLSLTPISGPIATTQLTWQLPAALPPGRYPVLVSVFDNGCTHNAYEERTILFLVGSNAALATRSGLLAAAEVYPTPFRDQVQFKTAPNQGVVLFDALGREVARLTSAADGQVHWQPAPTLPAGLYLARSAASGQPIARLLRAE